MWLDGGSAGYYLSTETMEAWRRRNRICIDWRSTTGLVPGQDLLSDMNGGRGEE